MNRPPRNSAPPLLLMPGVLLVALNLRPVIAAFGPLLAQIQAELGLNAATVSLLTSIPLLCWGAFALLAPLLVRSRSAEVVILACLALIGTGALLRAGQGFPVILLGTVLVGSGIAVVNVLLPSLLRRDFPERLGLMTGLYTTAVVGGAALASAASVPIRTAFQGSWRAALGVWAVLALVGALAWWPAVRGRPVKSGLQAAPGASIWHNPATLPVTAFMGTQSMVFFIWMTWLPKILIDQGLTSTQAGLMLSLGNLVQLPFALYVPILAARLPSPRPIVTALSACVALGIAGLMLHAPPLPVTLLLGIGSGAAFPLALYLIARRARSAQEAPNLSAVAQGLGYLFAATGPTLFGAAHDLTHGWQGPLTLHLGLTALMLLMGLWASRDFRSTPPPADSRPGSPADTVN